MEEASYYPKREFDPAATILFRLYQLGLAREDLVSVLRSKAKVNKVLSGQLEITRWNARKLGKFLGIPATDLLAAPEEGLDEPMDGIEPLGFPQIRLQSSPCGSGGEFLGVHCYNRHCSPIQSVESI